MGVNMTVLGTLNCGEKDSSIILTTVEAGHAATVQTSSSTRLHSTNNMARVPEKSPVGSKGTAASGRAWTPSSFPLLFKRFQRSASQRPP